MNRGVRSFRSRRQKHKRLTHNFYKYSGIGLGVLSIFFSLVLLARADFLKVNTVAVSGTEIVDKELITQIVNDELGSKRFWLFPKSNFFLFPRKLTEDKIKSRFATVANVSVSVEGLHTASVDVAEYKPAFLWCDSLAREKCYFMTEQGYIFNESADFSQGVLFTYYGLVNREAPIGARYTTEERFKELNSFVDSLKLLSMTPVGLNALGESDYEAYLSTGGKVIFSAREPFLTTFENLESVVAEQKKTDPNFIANLDYVDVRFASKVFVKMK